MYFGLNSIVSICIFAQVQPTGFLGVPRVWEKIREKMLEAASRAGYGTRTVAAWAKGHGLNYYKAMQEGRLVKCCF